MLGSGREAMGLVKAAMGTNDTNRLRVLEGGTKQHLVRDGLGRAALVWVCKRVTT